MVSWDSRGRSPLYLSWISFIFGCNADIIFMDRLCFTESGNIAPRTSTVNTMIARPKLEKNTEYNSTRLLIIGLIMSPFQSSPISSKSVFPLVPILSQTPCGLRFRGWSGLTYLCHIQWDRVFAICKVDPCFIRIAVTLDV